ncbi:hypothetical protein GCM10017687_24050 [Streptomyces echinatus]
MRSRVRVRLRVELAQLVRAGEGVRPEGLEEQTRRGPVSMIIRTTLEEMRSSARVSGDLARVGRSLFPGAVGAAWRCDAGPYEADRGERAPRP